MKGPCMSLAHRVTWPWRPTPAVRGATGRLRRVRRWGAVLASVWAMGCGEEADCVRNQIEFQPIRIGETKRIEFGVLDDAHSECSPIAPPAGLTWASDPDGALRVDPDGRATAGTVGRFTAEGRDSSGRLQIVLTGFVLPGPISWEIVREGPESPGVGEEISVSIRVWDDAGREVPGHWGFVIAKPWSAVGQLGCKPVHQGSRCWLIPDAPGPARVEVSIGDEQRAFDVQVGAREPGADA